MALIKKLPEQLVEQRRPKLENLALRTIGPNVASLDDSISTREGFCFCNAQ